MGIELIPTEIERQTLIEQLPLIDQISDKNLRELVIKVWVRLWRESPYRDIIKAPNYLTAMGGEDTLIHHVSAVVKMTQAVAKEFQKAYNADLNFDVLLAGALLHDVDKLVLYECQGNLVQLSELGHKVGHGEYGATIAKELGLPQEVVNIIACHSPAQDKVLPATVEAVLLAGCDTANFQAYRLMNSLGLWRKP